MLLAYSARMRMPPFNAQGDLPPGVHQATEVIERFGQGAPERVRVTERLQQIIALAQETRKLERVFIWGSYVTARYCGGIVVIQNEQELEVTRQRIVAFQDALLALRRNQSPSNYAQITKNFLYEIKKMEEEVHEYLQRLPVPEHTSVA